MYKTINLPAGECVIAVRKVHHTSYIPRAVYKKKYLPPPRAEVGKMAAADARGLFVSAGRRCHCRAAAAAAAIVVILQDEFHFCGFKI